MQAFTVKFRQLFRTCEVCTMERWRGNKVVAECTLGLGTCVPLCWMQLALQTVALSPPEMPCGRATCSVLPGNHLPQRGAQPWRAGGVQHGCQVMRTQALKADLPGADLVPFLMSCSISSW